MKLLNITNRYYIVVALALLLVSSVFLAYRTVYVIDNEITKHMLYKKLQIERQISSQEALQNKSFFISDLVKVDTIERFTTFRVQIKDTIRYDELEEVMIPYRVMTYEQIIAGGAYRISISQRLTQNRDLLSGLAITFILVAIDIIACFYFLNRYFSSNIWRPFYRALETLKRFDLRKGGSVGFEQSRIDEFNALNDELVKLTDKVTSDYRNLKEFTENMSHETQTPLAIIRSKLELLLQADNILPDQLEQIHATLDAINRLTKMNRGLIMLTRIENEQFSDEEPVSIAPLVKKRLEDLDLFIQSRELHVEESSASDLTVRMNPYLADILVSNLLSNAIKYNEEHGQLVVQVHSDSLVIANSGKPLPFPPEQIFGRFKHGNSPDSVGLGLAIVKRICDYYQFFLSYQHQDGLHRFYIQFTKERRTNLT